VPLHRSLLARSEDTSSNAAQYLMPSDCINAFLSPGRVRCQWLCEKALVEITGRAEVEPDEFNIWYQEALALTKRHSDAINMSMRAMPRMLDSQ